MHKSLIQRIYSRIGYWIRYERRKRLEISQNIKYKQENFILLNDGEKYFNLKPNEEFCSRSTLSRIENGKIIFNTQLITFILKRFNKKYRIIESEQHIIDSTVNAFYIYFFSNNRISIKYLKKILDDTHSKVNDNFLWDEDYKILNRILLWIEDFTLIQKNELDEYLNKFKIYHTNIQDVLIYYIVFSVYFNIELWSNHLIVSRLIKENYASNELLKLFDDVFNKHPSNVYKTFYQNKHLLNDSGFLNEIIIPINYMFENHFLNDYKPFNNLVYMRLIHKIIVKDYSVNTEFESNILNFIKNYSIEGNSEFNDILTLIKDEPYPRVINELIIKHVYTRNRSKSHMQKILSFIFE